MPLWLSRGCSSATTTFKTALKDSETCGSGAAEESGILAWYWQSRVESLRDPIDRYLPLSSPTTACFLSGRGFVVLKGICHRLFGCHRSPLGSGSFPRHLNTFFGSSLGTGSVAALPVSGRFSPSVLGGRPSNASPVAGRAYGSFTRRTPPRRAPPYDPSSTHRSALQGRRFEAHLVECRRGS
jgi:hypothetical protein